MLHKPKPKPNNNPKKLSTMYRKVLLIVKDKQDLLEIHGICFFMIDLEDDNRPSDVSRILKHFNDNRPTPELHAQFFNETHKGSSYWWPSTRFRDDVRTKYRYTFLKYLYDLTLKEEKNELEVKPLK